MIYYQQGDVLLKQAKIPTEAQELSTNILHKGLDHEHKLVGVFKLYQYDDSIYLKSVDCTLVHDEHSKIVIRSGEYKKDIVKEYDHWLEESREIID